MNKINNIAKYIQNIKTTPIHFSNNIVLYNGDCLNILKDVPDSSIDLICADPPYGNNKTNHRLAKMANNTPDLSRNLFYKFMAHAKRILRPGGCCCCFCSSGGSSKPLFHKWVDQMSNELEYKNTIVWDKENIGLGSHYRQAYEFILVAKKRGAKCIWNGGHKASNILRVKRPLSTKVFHPTPKPIELISMLIEYHSNAGDVILDPFAGSGTTMLAAKLLKRKSIGIELDKGYCKLIINRLEKQGLPSHQIDKSQ